MQFFKNIYYSFPLQLLILHLRQHQILLLFWILLFLTITNNFGKSFGVPYLFLDPEYLGKVDFVSFSILGAAFGGFLMTWNITTYILNSHRFPFLASFHRPFAMFSLNNSILPIAFVITYVLIVINFQAKSEFSSKEDIAFEIAGFLSGLLIIIFITALYFETTNKDIFALFGLKLKEAKRIRKKVVMRKNLMWEDLRRKEDEMTINTYVTTSFRIRHIRSVKHYDKSMLQSVFKQNHSNALVIELVALATLIGLGFLIDYEIFRIPAGASGLMLFAILVSLSGVFSFWLKGWKNTALILIILIIDSLIRFDVFTYENMAYGLDYNKTPALFTYENLKRISSEENINTDIDNMIGILDKWKENTGKESPKMVLLNFSGGGLSSATFSMLIVQKADSLLGGDLLKHTALMTGASGGMFGATYIRELYLRKQLGYELEHSFYDKKYADNIAKDLLNSVLFTIVANDLFYPWQQFSIGDNVYRKDRGYIFEKQLNENTNYVMDKALKDYSEYEKNATIPLLIYVPTIINDQRKLVISTQPVSFMMKPFSKTYTPSYTDIDAVDYGALFQQQSAQNLKVTTAVRMSATYPYILPYITLPSQPVIKVMDAGFRDNYGIETSVRFMNVFQDWIKENTSGVVVVQVRSMKKEREIEGYQTETMFDRFTNPIANLYSNWGSIQDYNQNSSLNFASEVMDGNLEVINFEYIPEKKEEKAAMSLRLTTKEKEDILFTLQFPHIEENLTRLRETLDY